MAHHKSAIKRIRQISKQRLHNRYYAKTTRNAVTNFLKLESKEEAIAQLPTVKGLVDKLCKKNQLHANKASRMKSSLDLHVNGLAA